MKSRLGLFSAMLAMISLVCSCSNGIFVPTSTSEKNESIDTNSSNTHEDFKTNIQSVELKVGETKKINVTRKPIDALGDVVWSVEDETIAAVTSQYGGLQASITALKVGSTTVKAQIDGTDHILSISIDVVDVISTPSITLDSDSKDVKENASFSISASLHGGITYDDLDWSVGDESILDLVSTSSGTANLRALSIGDTYVRAECKSVSSVYDECLVHVAANYTSGWPVISENAGNYYSSIDFTKSPSNLLSDLNALNKKNKKSNSYDDLGEILSYTQADPKNESNVILIYTSESRKYTGISGTNINREHVWPNSRGAGKSGPGADPFNITLADAKENGGRGNNVYGEKSDSSCYYVESDLWKGSCARSVMYTHMAYYAQNGLVLNDDPSYTKNSSKNMGKISVILKWEVENPVDNSTIYEMRRNDRTQEKVNNRNPFVDIPGLSLYLYGGYTSTTKSIYRKYASQFGLNPDMY